MRQWVVFYNRDGIHFGTSDKKEPLLMIQQNEEAIYARQAFRLINMDGGKLIHEGSLFKCLELAEKIKKKPTFEDFRNGKGYQVFVQEKKADFYLLTWPNGFSILIHHVIREVPCHDIIAEGSMDTCLEAWQEASFDASKEAV